ncbi:hypothetical protein BDR04DRAFT_578230 [Suillus decipiens]|nr:hypothetical protein BDR04DRAFT_578230 [Suillus decipiens]
MTQSTSHTSFDSSDSFNVIQYTPNTGMHMSQFPYPRPAYIPYQGCAPVHSYYPYGVQPDGTLTAPKYMPAAPSLGVGPGVAHHALQAGENDYCPPVETDVSCTAYVDPHSLPTAVGSHPQNPSARPLYNQPFPFSSSPTTTTHYIGHDAHQSYPPAISQQAYLHQPPGAELATGFASTSLSVSKKRAAEECVADDRNPKRHKGDAEAPDFGVILEVEKAALVEPILPPPQVREITLGEAGGDIKFWRWINDLADSVDPAPPPSDSAASPPLETLVAEVAENTHPDFAAGNEIEDIVLVEPALALSQLREIPLTVISGDLEFWRWIDSTEDIALPLSDSPVSIPLAAVGGDLDFWMWINNIENIALPLSDSPVSSSLESQATEDTEEDIEEDTEDFYSWMSRHDIVIPEPVEDPEFWKFHPGREHPAFLYNINPFD